MRRELLCISFVSVLAASLVADSNLRITDVGLHGYYGTPTAVRLILRNPSSQPQIIHLQVAAGKENDVTNTTADAEELWVLHARFAICSSQGWPVSL